MAEVQTLPTIKFTTDILPVDVDDSTGAVILPDIEEEKDKDVYEDSIFKFVNPEDDRVTLRDLYGEDQVPNLPEIDFTTDITPVEIPQSNLPPLESFPITERTNDIPIDENNFEVVNIDEYFNSLSQYQDPNKNKLFQLYKDNKLTKEDILSDEVLMKIVRNSISSRYADTTVSKLYGGFTAMMGADSGGASIFSPYSLTQRNYAEMSDNEVFERWQQWMRTFNAGNSVTVINEVIAGMNAEDNDRAKIGAGYLLFSRMGNVFTTGTWRELGDALIDYGRGGIYDPTVLMSLGLGKIIATPIIKAKSEGVRRLMIASYKDLIAKGVAPEVARKKIYNSIATRKALVAGTAFAIPDFVFNVGIDLLQQTQLINVDNQDELDLNRTTTVAFASMAVPALFTGSSIAIRKLRTSDAFKDTFLAYDDITRLMQTSRRNVEDIIRERVEPNIPEMVEKLDANFGMIKGNQSKLIAWEDAKKRAKEIIESEGQPKDPYLQDLNHTLGFFKELFFDTVDEKGNVITQGYISALRDAGFVFHKDMVSTYKISGVLGQAIEYLPDDTVKKLVKSYEDRTGKSLNLGENYFNANPAQALSARFIDTSSTVGKFLNIPSQAVREIMIAIDEDVANAAKISMGMADVTRKPENFKFLLSTYKRILTSHPATTGSNLKGFAALSMIDSATELMSSVVHLAQVPYQKFINRDPKKVDQLLNSTAANFFSSGNRFAGILAPDLPIEYAKKVLDMNPAMYEKIFREIAGDGGVRSGINMFDLDKQGLLYPLAKGVDATTKAAQAISLVRLQDEYTKLFSFGINVDKYIIEEYGMSPLKFWRRDDVAAEMITPRFQNNVLEKAKYQTLRATASVNWNQLNKMQGKNFMRQLARWQEDLSNKTIAGFALPFGSFNNTVIANFGDFSGINFLRFSFLRYGLGRELDPETQDYTTSFAKAAVAYSTVFLRTFYGENSAINKVNEGRAFNENYTIEGDVRNSVYDWPQNLFDMAAQMVAHGVSGEGRDFYKDIENMNPVEISEYLRKNFKRENVPEELQLKFSTAVFTGAYKDLDKIYNFIARDFLGFINGTNPKEVDDFILESLGTVAGRISSGVMRPLEPVNMLFNLLRFDGEVPDLKQGNILYNQAFKYVNSLLPESSEQSPANMEKEFTILQGGDVKIDITKGLFNARRSQKSSVLTRMLNKAGYDSWNLTQEAWGKDPRVKNALDKVAAPIAELLARKYLEKHPRYDTYDLNAKRKVINDLRTDLRELSMRQLELAAPKNLSVLRELLKKGNDFKRNKALKSMISSGLLEEGASIDSIVEMEDVEESTRILNYLKYLMENYDDIFIITPGAN